MDAKFYLSKVGEIIFFFFFFFFCDYNAFSCSKRSQEMWKRHKRNSARARNQDP